LFRDLIQIILPYGSSVSIFEIGLNPSTGGVFLSQVTAGIVSIIGGLIRLYSNVRGFRFISLDSWHAQLSINLAIAGSLSHSLIISMQCQFILI